MNYWLIFAVILLLVIGTLFGHYVWKETPNITTVPVIVTTKPDSVPHPTTTTTTIPLRDVSSAFEKKIQRLKDSLMQSTMAYNLLRDSIDNLPVKYYSTDTTQALEADATYKTADSADVHIPLTISVAMSAGFYGEPINQFNYINAHVLPFTIPIQQNTFGQNVSNDDSGFWILPEVGILHNVGMGTMFGYEILGVGWYAPFGVPIKDGTLMLATKIKL